MLRAVRAASLVFSIASTMTATVSSVASSNVKFKLKPFAMLFAVLCAYAFALLSVRPVRAAAIVPPGVQLAERQELVRQMPAEDESIDPAYIESWDGNTIGLDLFEGLTRIDASGAVAPGVAESWARTGPTTWVFKLRHDARWSNGDPVTAADFLYSWRRTVDPKTGSPYTILVEFIKNAKAIIAGKLQPSALGARAPDPYTLEVTTEVPAAFFPQLVAMSTMVPLNRAVLTKYGNAWTRPDHFVGNGAYTLVRWDPNDRLVMRKNDDYWNASHVVIRKVTYQPIEDDQTAFRMYEAGQFDYTYQIPSGMFRHISHVFPDELRQGVYISTYFYSLNNADPALKDRRVREALSMVIDRDLLTSKLTGSGERPLYGLIPHNTGGADVFTPQWAAWPMDKRIAYARELMRQAGYSSAHPLSLTLTYNTNDLHKKVALFTSYQWHKLLGIDVKLENVEYKVLLKERHEGKTQVSRDGWFADYNDAMSFFDQLRCGSVQNDQHYCNPQVDALVDDANRQSDDAKRKALLTDAHALAMRDYPLVPLFQYAAVRLVKPYVGGYKLTNDLDARASSDMYIIKH